MTWQLDACGGAAGRRACVRGANDSRQRAQLNFRAPLLYLAIMRDAVKQHG
jgi:hypothetical protein